jgi:hypothetical protein
MKLWKCILLLSILLLVAVKYFALTIEYADNDFIFAGLIIGFYFLLFFIVSGIIFKIEYAVYKKYSDFKVFKLTFVSLIIFIFGIGLHIYNGLKDTSDIIIEAGQNFDLNHIKLELREDNTYKFTNGSVLGNSYCRGNYIRKDSIIILDTTKSDRLLQSNYLAIRGNEIFMINSKHKIIDSTFYFIIN